MITFPLSETVTAHAPCHVTYNRAGWSTFLKSLTQSKSVPKMRVFRKFRGLNIKCSHRDHQKALRFPERRRLTYFA